MRMPSQMYYSVTMLVDALVLCYTNCNVFSFFLTSGTVGLQGDSAWHTARAFVLVRVM